MGSAKTASGLIFRRPVKDVAITAIVVAFAFVLQSCGADVGAGSLEKYADVKGPALSFRCPQRDATRVGSAPSVSFNISDGGYGVDETLITSAIFILEDSSGTSVDGTFAYSGGTVTYSDIILVEGVYTVKVTGLQDKGGNVASSYSWNFTAQPDLASTAGTSSNDSTGLPACPAAGGGGGGGDSGGYGPIL